MKRAAFNQPNLINAQMVCMARFVAQVETSLLCSSIDSSFVELFQNGNDHLPLVQTFP